MQIDYPTKKQEFRNFVNKQNPDVAAISATKKIKEKSHHLVKDMNRCLKTEIQSEEIEEEVSQSILRITGATKKFH